jgi:hypothetical protein
MTMTESERDRLMPFLRNLVQTKTSPGDDAASNLIRAALGKQPNATYLLVQRALILENALAAAQARIDHLEGKPRAVAVVQPNVDFLDPQTTGWGEGVDRTGQRSRDKMLFDMFKQMQTSQGMDLESRAVHFLTKNAGKVWLFILALGCVVVALR